MLANDGRVSSRENAQTDQGPFAFFTRNGGHQKSSVSMHASSQHKIDHSRVIQGVLGVSLFEMQDLDLAGR